jgi:hypothetical protein
LHLLFFPLVRILCALRLENRKKSTLSWWGTFGISVSSAEGMSHQPIHNPVAASAIVILSWQDVTQSSLCSGVQECGTKHAHNFFFPNPKNYSLGDVQRFCYHSWCNSMSIF